jgi:aryl-alcohol dehydrogenase-like predicted oxidoreductase
MPVNPAEPQYLNFIDDLIPFARQKDMGIIAMKVYIRGMASRIPGVGTVEPFSRFALSHPVTMAIIGCDTIAQLEENVRCAWSFAPMKDGEIGRLSELVAPYARKLMYYKP